MFYWAICVVLEEGCVITDDVISPTSSLRPDYLSWRSKLNAVVCVCLLFVSHLWLIGLNALWYQSHQLELRHLACGHKGSLMSGVPFPSGTPLV